MNVFFEELGQTVYENWRDANFSPSEFPGLARAALETFPPNENVKLGELVQDFLLEDDQPFQTASGFGQPELVVYDNPRFYIQALFWMDGTTQIHQHEFSGAFHVLVGSSLHSEYSFGKPRPVSAHFRMGQLELTSTELLETGRTVEIVAGRSHIHSLFHLETPSVTIVVRTHSDPGTGPQFTYLPPHVAVDPFHSDTLSARRLQLLDVMERCENPSYGDTIMVMLEELDFERGFFVLQNCQAALNRIERWDEALGIFREKHGRLAAGVKETLEEIVWRDRLVGLRGAVTDPEHRFFLALLLNVPDRKTLLDFVAKRFPKDPVGTVLRWAEELTGASDDGTWVLDAEFPGNAGVPPDERPEIFLGVLSQMLGGEGQPPGPVPDRLKHKLHRALAASSLRVLLKEGK